MKVFFSTRTRSYIKPEIVDLSRHGILEKILGIEEAFKWGIRHYDELWPQPV